MTAEPIVSVRGARRRYGAFEAVRGVDLEVRRGELVALLGTNGAGKTSLVELVEGLAPADGGEISLLGHDPYRERRHVVPRVGIMLQEAGFSSDLTTAETARMWAGTLSRPRPVGEVLYAVGLAHRAGVRVGSLSGGERRRLDLALAILGDPEVLFLDEPTTGLDPESRQATWRLVRGLLAEGTTVLLTTHYLEEAEELADRIAIMQAGRIVRAGTVAEVTAAEPARIEFAPRDARGLAVARRLICRGSRARPATPSSRAAACGCAPPGCRTTSRPCWPGPASAGWCCTSSRRARPRSSRRSSPWPPTSRPPTTARR
jgi:ABC-2 type transport system ATP-binding protein